LPRRLLDDGLRLLPWGIDGSLEEQAEPAPVLGAYSVRATLPACRVQRRARALDAELPARVGRAEARRSHQEVWGGLALPAVDLLLYRATVHEQGKGAPHGGVREERMRGPGIGTLAFHLPPRI